MPLRTEWGDAYLTFALMDIIRNTGVLPQATLDAPASAADHSITLTTEDAQRIRRGQLLWFYDGADGDPQTNLSENVNPGNQMPGPIPVDSVNYDTGEVMLSWKGRSWSGLQQAHAEGALVGWNLVDFAPGDDAAWLDLGDPSAWVFPDHERVHTIAAPNRNQSLRTVWIQYDIPLERPAPLGDADALDPNLFGRDQQARARIDMDGIKQALLGNRLLTVNGRPFAEDLGDGSGLILTKDWQRLDDDTGGTVPRLRAGLQLLVKTRK